jgi:hypothetical protein
MMLLLQELPAQVFPGLEACLMQKIGFRIKLATVKTHRNKTHRNVWRAGRPLAAASLLAGFLLPACTGAPSDSPADSRTEAVQQQLVGSWLREYSQEGAQVRRLLVLGDDGRFTETARVVDAGGAVTEHAHEGQWTFDGTNLKRRYTNFDGKQPSAPVLPYVTFQLKFESKHEFVGIDNVRKREVHYSRVQPGAALF